MRLHVRHCLCHEFISRRASDKLNFSAIEAACIRAVQQLGYATITENQLHAVSGLLHRRDVFAVLYHNNYIDSTINCPSSDGDHKLDSQMKPREVVHHKLDS